MMRTILFLAAVLLIPTAATAHPCITLVTQNALHLGQDDPSTKADKLTGLNMMIDQYKWKNTNDPILIVLLQEVMYGKGTYDPWNGMGNVNYLITDSWGANTYYESYGFAIDRNYSKQIKYVNFAWDLEDIKIALTGDFARPPGGILVTCGDGTNPDKNIWLLNFHVTFAKPMSMRNDELEAAADAIEAYLGCAVDPKNPGKCEAVGTPGTWSANNAIMGGDWNRNKKLVEKFLCRNISSTYNCEVFMSDKTSINRLTGNWASPYDHLVSVYKNSNPFRIAASKIGVAKYGKANLTDFVNNVSDHIGVENVIHF